MHKESRTLTIALDVLTFAVVFILLFPIIWLYVTSVRPHADMVGNPLDLIPSRITFGGYQRIWNAVGFQAAFRNSLIVASVTSVIVTIIALMTAYSLSRFRFRGQGAVSGSILALQMLPGIVMVVPLILILQRVRLTNSLVGLVIVYLLAGIPVAVWMIKGYMDEIPTDLDDAAMMDGADALGVLRRILIPLLAPAIVAVGAFVFILCWGEFLFALSLITSTDKKTLPLALQAAFGQYTIDWGMLTAGGVIISLPPAILFIFFQRWLVGGLTTGGVKG